MAAGWLAKCCIESDTGVRLCGETKPQLGATRLPPSYKVHVIFLEREGCLNQFGAFFFFAHAVVLLGKFALHLLEDENVYLVI